ncbi:MAG: nuclear transport factor 2 family protein [Sulfuricurvum sp.]|nr:nuclear transport factor 2 family protein [Sulfuricurvum sp.]
MKLIFGIICLITSIMALGSDIAPQNDPHAADRKALVEVFREIENGINKGNVELMLAQMTPDATVTWLNGETSRGDDEIRKYYNKMLKSNDKILNSYTTTAQIDAHARFYGNVALADGHMSDHFVPVKRSPFSLESRWSSTSVKTEQGWKVASLHLSSNVFTNPLIDEAKLWINYGILGGGLVGIIIGFFFGWKMKKNRGLLHENA